MSRHLVSLALVFLSAEAWARDTLAFVPARRLSIMAEGCTITDLGGIEKERALYQEWTRPGEQLLSVTGGDTFVDGKRVDEKAARGLADGLKSLGVRIVAPGPGDFALPISSFRELAGRTGSAWLSTNVTGTGAPLEAFRVERTATTLVRFLSVVPCAASMRKQGWRCQPPESSLGKALNSGVSPEEFVVVVTSLKAGARDRLIRRFPRVNAWLDAVGTETRASVEARSTTSIVAAAPALGQFVVRLELDGGTAKGPFVDALLLEDARKSRKTSPAMRKSIENIPWAEARSLRVTVDPVSAR